MADQDSKLLVQNRGGVTVVSFLDFSVLDRAEIDAIGDELVNLVDQHGKKRLLINFEGVDYLSSTMLGKLIVVHKRVMQHHGQLKLCGIKPSIREVFEITKLDKVFDIYEDEDDAMSDFRSTD
jgi:anti-sigma B factor antagonist